MPENSSLVSVRLPNELRDEIDAVARLTKRSRSFIVKEAVATYVEEQRAYRAAIGEALGEADRGDLVSGDAVFEWLSGWGSDGEAPEPQPGRPTDRKS